MACQVTYKFQSQAHCLYYSTCIKSILHQIWCITSIVSFIIPLLHRGSHQLLLVLVYKLSEYCIIFIMFSFCPFLWLKVQAAKLCWCLITFILRGCEWLVSYSSHPISKCRNLSMTKVDQKAMSYFFSCKYSWIMKIIHNKKWCFVSTMPCLSHTHKFSTNWWKSKGTRLGRMGGWGNCVQPNLVMVESSHLCAALHCQTGVKILTDSCEAEFTWNVEFFQCSDVRDGVDHLLSQHHIHKNYFFIPRRQ